MKTRVVILATALMLMGLTLTFGQSVYNSGDPQITKEAVTNYLKGLKSDNHGLRLSCAYYLGEYGISEGMVPLMNMLHNEKTESGRIMAALALTKLGSEMSIYAVKQASIFDKSERVRNLCLKFYNSYAVVQNAKSSM